MERWTSPASGTCRRIWFFLLHLAIASLVIAQVPQGEGLDFLMILFACTALLAGG